MISSQHFDKDVIYRCTLGDANSIINNPYHKGTITAGVSTGFSVNQTHPCYDFDGANTKIDTGSDWIGTQAVSVSAWIYADSYGEYGGQLGRIIDNGYTQFSINGTNTSPNYNIKFTSAAGARADSAASSILLNTWYHVVVTRTVAGIANIYINGVLSGTANQSSGTPHIGDSNVIIGNANNSAVSFDGKISDLIVYDRVLTAQEVSNLYNSRMYAPLPTGTTAQVVGSDVIAGWDFNNWTTGAGATITGVNTYTSQEGQFSYIYKSLGLTVGTRYLMTINGSASGGGSFKILTGSSIGLTNYTASYNTTIAFTALSSNIYFVSHTTASTVTINTFTIQPITQEAGGLLCDVNALKGAIIDQTGQRTLTNTSVTTTNYGSLNVMSFDGANSKLDTGSDWIGTTDITASAWVYARSWGEAPTGFTNAILNNGKFFILFYNPVAEGTKRVRLSSNDSTLALAADNSFSLNKWYHVAVTRSTNGTANFYVNGVLSGIANQASGTPVAGTTNVIIGNNNGQNYTFDGYISQVKVWNKILDTNQISQLYTSNKGRYGL